MVNKNCVICGIKFKCLNSGLTCGEKCSKINKLKKTKLYSSKLKLAKYCLLCNNIMHLSSKFCKSCSRKEYLKNNEHPLKGKLGKSSFNWKGGRRIIGRGYIHIYQPNHPNNVDSCVREHRLVMEKHLGRYLTKEEVVHHINGIRNDNRLENLMLFKNSGEHSAYHKRIGNKNEI